MLKPFATRTKEEMRDVLMEADAVGPEVFYYMIRGGNEKKNVTVWESGLCGREYIKSFGHYHVGEIDETYWVDEGEGLILLQVRKKDSGGRYIDDEIESFLIIKVKRGDSVFIPSGAGHLALNMGKTWLVTVDDSPVNFEEVDPIALPRHADYEPVRKLRGFAYYIVEEDGQPKAVENPNYRSVPEPEWLSAEEYGRK